MARTKQSAQCMHQRRLHRQQLAAKRQHGVDVVRRQKQLARESACGVKIGRRFRPGTKALREIRLYQNATHNLIQKRPFERLVKEIAFCMGHIAIRFQTTAIEALQEAAEHYLVQLFEDAQLACLHAKRITIQVQDVRLVRRLRGEDGRRFC